MDEQEKLYSSTAEDTILGAVLAYADRCLDDVRSSGLKEGDFYKPASRVLFHTFMGMADSGLQIAINTVMLQIQKQSLEKDIPLMYLTSLMSKAGPFDARKEQIQEYAKTIKDYSARREMQDIARCLLSDSQDMSKKTVAISGDVQERLTAITATDSGDEWETMYDSMVDYLEIVGERQGGEKVALQTGFIDLDNAIGGLERGDLAILAARPSMGKSALALNIATNVCKRGGRVLFVSMEMPKAKLFDRMVSNMGGINYSRLKQQVLERQEYSRVLQVCEEIKNFKLDIYDRRVTVAEIMARARLAAAKFGGGLDLIVVDHVQITKGNGRYSSRVHEVGEISHGLKDIATRLNVPVLALSQLSRASEGRDDKRPVLSDLRESGDLEQDADFVFALYRESYYTRDDNDKRAELGILKARDGELKNINLMWFGHFQRFRSATSRRE